MISIIEKENNEKIKLYDTLNTKLWGMVDILPYFLDKLNPDEKYNLMVSLDETKKELEAEGEI
jgi:hypothetical protein